MGLNIKILPKMCYKMFFFSVTGKSIEWSQFLCQEILTCTYWVSFSQKQTYFEFKET